MDKENHTPENHFIVGSIRDLTSDVKKILENQGTINISVIDLRLKVDEKFKEIKDNFNKFEKNIKDINSVIHKPSFQNAINVLENKYGNKEGYEILEETFNKKADQKQSNKLILDKFKLSFVERILTFLTGGGLLWAIQLIINWKHK